ncbi:MAG TPA: UbiA family prenyltransferase [Anaerolineales bacterium]|nr:UbiA family prenyltransferase [Anaerolineales bacterium]
MNRFFALSRTTHGVLDIANPAFVAVLWLGQYPSLNTIILSIITAFAAYTATYALNDLAGFSVDKEKYKDGMNAGYSVESSDLRYPLAQNKLSYRSGFLWFLFWAVIGLAGSYFLNPVIDLILLSAFGLEILYVRLLKVTYWRTLVSGLVKSSGPISAIFVVDQSPELWKVLLVFAWVLFWEIGGQNIAADWNDIEEDKRVHAVTIPLVFGPKKAGLIGLSMLTLTVIVSAFLPSVSNLSLSIWYPILTVIVGIYLLIVPGIDLWRHKGDGRKAAFLFDRASYYPLANLILITFYVLLF